MDVNFGISMVFENEREGEIKETFSSMPKNERAAQKFSSLLKSRNVNTRKKEREIYGRHFRHPTPYQTAMSMKIYMHAGWDARDPSSACGQI